MAAQVRQPWQRSPQVGTAANTEAREIRAFSLQSDDDGDHADNSDSYSFEARSDTSYDAAASQPRAGIVTPSASTRPNPSRGGSSDPVRPDSLALTSPLEQLSRSLSFRQKDRQPGPLNSLAQGARYEYAQYGLDAAQPTHVLRNQQQQQDQQPRSANAGDSQALHHSADTTPYHYGSNPEEAHQALEEAKTRYEPVRFTEDSSRLAAPEDTSDGQSMLISAFRSSYHTYATHGGANRESSYSWIAHESDSPNVTLDFKQAEAVYKAANHEDEEAVHDEHNLSSDRSQEPEVEDLQEWDPDGKSKARASSWDSEAAQAMGLHRIPSQKTTQAGVGRASGTSAFDPFQYADFESELRASYGDAYGGQARNLDWTLQSQSTLRDSKEMAGHALSATNAYQASTEQYAYPIASPSMPPAEDPRQPTDYTATASAPMPGSQRVRSQGTRTNYSRPHESLARPPPLTQTVSGYDQQASYAPRQAGTRAMQGHLDPVIAHNLPGHHEPYSDAAWGRHPYDNASMKAHTRPDMHTIGSYQEQYSSANIHANASGQDRAPCKHKRTPSQIMASAISKHRAQREAAGLNTDGEYYVDPRTKKYYFVASSGQAGGVPLNKTQSSGGKENPKVTEGTSAKQKERRKLYKKEAGWEVSKVGGQMAASVSPPVTPQTFSRGRSLSQSARSAASSKASEDEGSHGKNWKIWASGRSYSSQNHHAQASPIQVSADRNVGALAVQGGEDNRQEWIAEAPVRPTVLMHALPPGMNHVPQASTSASQSGHAVPLAKQRSPSPASVRLEAPHLEVPFGHAGDRGSPHLRSGSVYSNYSYYEMPSDQGHPVSSTSSHRGPYEAVPMQTQTQKERSPSPSRTPVPLSSPYIAPTELQFQPGNAGSSHSRQPSTTLDKAKHSIHRSASLQLLAPAKQENLTVPKASSSRNKDADDLSKLPANHPLVCLHRGIDAHEQGDLELSTQLFRQSAEGGFGLGMLMYGLALRHGWGCESQPETGFQYLQRAAESVVQDLDRVVSGQIQLSEKQLEEQAAKSELVLSIYELGQCFLRGWGVAKDKKTALQYFTLAANLGDPDAQSELGFCYSTGRGCKKDLKQAAKYYRMAAKQGQISYGMQWIFKSKYDD